MQRVQVAVQEDAVLHEREVAFLLDLRQLRDPRGELGLAVGRDEGANPRQLVLAHRGVPLAHLLEVRRGRRAKVDLLEQAVYRVADLRCAQPGLAVAPAIGPALAHARRPGSRSTCTSTARMSRAP